MPSMETSSISVSTLSSSVDLSLSMAIPFTWFSTRVTMLGRVLALCAKSNSLPIFRG